VYTNTTTHRTRAEEDSTRRATEDSDSSRRATQDSGRRAKEDSDSTRRAKEDSDSTRRAKEHSTRRAAEDQLPGAWKILPEQLKLSLRSSSGGEHSKLANDLKRQHMFRCSTLLLSHISLLAILLRLHLYKIWNMCGMWRRRCGWVSEL
jgi:hypothetical protein